MPDTIVPQWLQSWGHFIKVHEKLLIIALAAFLLFRGGQSIENIYINHLDKQAQNQAVIVKADDLTNAKLNLEVGQLRAQADAQAVQSKAEMTVAIAALAAQQKKDAQSTPQQIDDRLQQLLQLKPGTVKSDPNTTQLSNDAANQIAQQLEQIPVLQIQVKDLTAELVSTEALVAKQQESITGLQKELVDEKKSHSDDVALEKAKAKRNWIRGFKVGVIVGAVGGEVIRVALGKP